MDKSETSNRGGMWVADMWGRHQACVIVACLALVGVCLQFAVGHVPHAAFVFPQNVIWGGVFMLAIVLSYVILGKTNKPVQRFFSGKIATLTSIGGLLAVLLIMGFTKQIPAAMGAGLAHPLHRIGFSHILSTWYFLLLYLYMLYVLSFVTIRRLRQFRFTLRDVAFTMNHLGLFITLFFGLISAADMGRYRMQAYTGSEYPEWRGTDEMTGKLTELPLAIELLEFEMQEYPPKLMIISNTSGRAIPEKRAESLQIDSVPIGGNIADWQIKVKEYLPYSAAIVSKDSILFREFRTRGAVHSAKVSVSSKAGYRLEGWVSAGSHIFPYRSLKLTDSLSLVMADPDPKQYSSRVVLYAPDGYTDTATIKVNKPLRYKSWYIYQLNYNRNEGRWSTMSEFELVHDSWLWGVYLGIFMLFAGAAMLFIGPLERPKKNITPNQTQETTT